MTQPQDSLVAKSFSFLLSLSTFQFIPLLLSTYLFARLIHFAFTHKRKQTLLQRYNIPCPPVKFFGGHLHLLQNEGDKYDMHQKLSKELGSLYGYYIASQAYVVCTDLRVLREVFLDSTNYFSERLEIPVKSKLFLNSILYCKRDKWKKARKVLAPAFKIYGENNSKSMQAIEENVDTLMQHLDKQVRVNREGKRVAENIDIAHYMEINSFNIIDTIALHVCTKKDKGGYSQTELIAQLNDFLNHTEDGIFRYAKLFPPINSVISFLANLDLEPTLRYLKKHLATNVVQGAKFLRHIQEQADSATAMFDNDSGIDKELADAYKVDVSTGKVYGEPDTLLHRMIKLHYEGFLSKSEVVSNAIVTMVAGFHTSATTLSYCLWALAKHQTIQDKLRAEIIDSGVESSYLKCVINETMRRYNIAPEFITRTADRDFTIDLTDDVDDSNKDSSAAKKQRKQIVIPKNAVVVYNQQLIHLDEKHWPEPLEFRPARFEKPVSDPLVFAPFGLGERRCIGMKIAEVTIKQSLVKMLLAYKILLVAPQELKLVRHAHSLTRPLDKIILKFEKL